MAEILNVLAGIVVSASSIADLLREVTLKNKLRLLHLTLFTYLTALAQPVLKK